MIDFLRDLTGVAVTGLWLLLTVLLTVIGMLIVGLVVGHLAQKARQRTAVRRFRAAFAAQGKDLLLVYSNSPNWQAYVEEQWLPRWGHRAVILNWSQRSTWARPVSPEVALFRAFSGSREYNPLGIVVPASGGEVHIVRFWQAFRDHKHGRDRRLKTAEAELDDYLN